MGYLAEALSGGATELADDFAAHGQKRLTGHPACQLSPGPSVGAVGEYRVHSSTPLSRPTETLLKVYSDLLYTYDISQQLSFAYSLVHCRASLYSEKKKLQC